MYYVLLHPLREEDFDFLNSTSIELNICNTFTADADDSVADSGWCDMVPGARRIGTDNMIVFMPANDEEHTLLLLKFGDRLIPSNLRKTNKLTS